MIGRYLRGVLIALDQAANAIFFGGFPDETLSSRMGRRLKRKRRAIESEATCAVLDMLEDEHCAKAIEETPDGETDAHHLGHVIHELPPPGAAETLRKLDASYARELQKWDASFYRPQRWRKLMAVAGALLLLAGCAGWPVVVVPYPAPSPSATPASVPTPIPDATPEPQPTATPAPTPAPPLPTPPPTPAPPTGPVCRDGCVSCAQFIAGELGSGALVRCEPGKAPSCRNGLAYNLVGGDINRPEFTDTASCLMTDASGNTRNRRHHNDGSVCEPGCVKATPAPPATPPPTPAPPDGETPQPGPTPGTCPALVRWGGGLHAQMTPQFQGIPKEPTYAGNTIDFDSTARFGNQAGSRGQACNDEHHAVCSSDGSDNGPNWRRCEDPRGPVWQVTRGCGRPNQFKTINGGWGFRVSKVDAGTCCVRITPRPDVQDAEGQPVRVLGDASSESCVDVQ